jgi:hypothetical protein
LRALTDEIDVDEAIISNTTRIILMLENNSTNEDDMV